MVVIPARWGSTRLPGKPLIEVEGQPLVERVRQRAAAAAGVDEVIVATDDERIAAAVDGPVQLTGEHPSGTHRVAAVLPALRAEHVINVQCDQPGLDPAHVAVVASLLAAGAEVATLAAPLAPGADPTDPAVVKVVRDAGGRALYFSRAPVPHGGPWLRHLGLYGFTRDALRRCTAAPPSALARAEDLEQLDWLVAGIECHVGLVEAAAPALDTPGQLSANPDAVGVTPSSRLP